MSSTSFSEIEKRHSVIHDLGVNVASLDQAVDSVVRYAVARKGFTFFTANLDHLVKMSEDSFFLAAYQRADFITADGWPIAWLGRQQGVDAKRTSGADLVDPVCKRAEVQGLSLFVVGPSKTSQTKALHVLRSRYANLDIVGAETPHISLPLDEAAVMSLADRIARSGARLCFLALGAPKQERLADLLHERCPEVGFLCVGAALDFISGHVARAPLWVQKSRLEWLWRLASDPRRLVLRYVKCMFLFAKLAYDIKMNRRSLRQLRLR